MEHIRRSMAAAKVKAEQDAAVKPEGIDNTIYDLDAGDAERVSSTPPTFEGRLNLTQFAFQQPVTNPFRRHRPTPKTEDSNSDTIKKEEGSPKNAKGTSRSRPLVLTPTPEPDESHVRVKREIKVESEIQVVTAPASESGQASTPPKIEKLEINSPLIAPIQSTEWDLPIVTAPKPEPGQEAEPVVEGSTRRKVRYRERVVIELDDSDDSSPEPEERRRSAAPTPSTSAPSRAATIGTTTSSVGPSSAATTAVPTAPSPVLRGMFAPPAQRPAPVASTAVRSPFFTTSNVTETVSSVTKRKSGSSGSGSPTKKLRPSSTYQPPEVYAHLKGIDDLMAPDMLGLIVGVNPGLKSAKVGHNYSGPSNWFWKVLHTGGLTERRLPPTADTTLPEKYQLGLTNVVDRPTRNQGELDRHEMVASTQALIDKVKDWKPEAVVTNGKGVWEAIWQVRHGRKIKKHEFKYGWQDNSERMGAPKSGEPKQTTADGKPWLGARVFVAASTSGSAAIPDPKEKERIWAEFGKWANERRKERGLAHYPPGPGYAKEKAAPAQIVVREVEVEMEENEEDSQQDSWPDEDDWGDDYPAH